MKAVYEVFPLKCLFIVYVYLFLDIVETDVCGLTGGLFVWNIYPHQYSITVYIVRNSEAITI